MSRYHPPTLLLLFSWALMNDPLSSPQALGEDAQPEGFVPLLNGKDLTGWKVYNGQESAWGTEDGLLFTRGGNGGWLMTQKVYADFELRLEYKMRKRGNSGIAIRSPFEGDPAISAMEIQLQDDPNYKGIKPVQYTGAIHDVAAPLKQAARPFGEWNQVRIVAEGATITVEINGTLVQKANLNDYSDRLQADPVKRSTAHPGLLRREGHVGLQSAWPGSRVSFRRLLIRELGDLTKK
jgi:Domain of Unknown Function (DUF1080)